MNELSYTLEGCAALAAVEQTALAAGKMHLYKSSLVPSPATPTADFNAAEADYDGYVAGGIAVATWNAPILDPLGGYSIGSPIVQFLTDPAIVAGNVIGGWYYTNAATKVVIYGTLATPLPMQVPGQGIPVNARLDFPPS